jgi:hypothetical protein
MEVVTFVDYQPPQRFDATPWTQVRIEESATQTGTYVPLETKALTPVDTDPANPAYRSFTTEKGTALDYWYRVVFVDATGDVSQPTTPVQNVAGSTVTTDVYATSDELFRRLKVRTPTVDQQAAATRVLGAAAGEINARMGRQTGLAHWELQLVAEVNLDRAEELWNEGEVPFGAIGLDNPSGPVFLSRKSRALAKLNVLQQSWGVA